jgi:AraC-like DNA-binding protein
MKIKVYKPKNDILNSIIDCFYILRHEKGEPNTTYITFPSVFTIVSLSPQVREFRHHNRILNKQDKSVELDSTMVCKFNKPICFEYEGAIVEITIYFKPLGINAILNDELITYTNRDNHQFKPFPDFTESILKIFSIENDSKKIAALEKYFLSKFKGFTHTVLESLVNDLSNKLLFEMPIGQIAKKNHTIPKTVLKHFERHICKTPSEFRKIIRFRNAIRQYLPPNQISLTKLGYMLNYFDQAHFIKEFKSLTGFAPKMFFKKISPVGTSKINWMFI